MALAGAASPIKTVIGFVITIFILFLFATTGLIANSNIQTQLKNGAYYAGNFSALVAILIALDFLGLYANEIIAWLRMQLLLLEA